MLGSASAGLLAFALVNRKWMGLVQEWKAGDMKHLEVLVPGAWWWGAVLLAGILGLLALTVPWWRGPWRVAEPAPEAGVPRWFAWALVGLMVAGAALRLPRMTLSLYNDESYSFRRHIAGAMTPAREGREPHFRPVRWTETCYQNLTGNNSMLFSGLARVSYDGWKAITAQPEGTVREWVIRLPVFCCGVLAIGAMGWLGMRLGGAWLGLLAALMTALHPWQIRYATEARCYGILMLLMPLLFLALRAALRTGRWRDWLTFGVLEYLTVACFFGAAHFLCGLNLLVAGGACLAAWRASPRGWGPALTRIVPLGVSGLLAAGAYLALNLPLFLQTARLVEDVRYMHSSFTLEWFQDAGSFLAFGLPGPARTLEGGVPVSLAQWWQSSQTNTTILVGLFSGLLVWGGAWLIRNGGIGRLIPAASLAGAVLTLAYCRHKGLILLPWYSIFLLPGVLLCLAAGMERMLKTTLNAFGPLPGGVTLVLLFSAWTSVGLVYQSRSRENLRAVVETVRGRPEAIVPPRGQDALLGVFWSEVPVYDRSAVVLYSKEDLEALMDRARREHRECFVDSMWRVFVLRGPADPIRIVEDPSQFEKVAVFPGLDEPGNTHVLWRMKPAAGLQPQIAETPGAVHAVPRLPDQSQ